MKVGCFIHNFWKHLECSRRRVRKVQEYIHNFREASRMQPKEGLNGARIQYNCGVLRPINGTLQSPECSGLGSYT